MDAPLERHVALALSEIPSLLMRKGHSLMHRRLPRQRLARRGSSISPYLVRCCADTIISVLPDVDEADVTLLRCVVFVSKGA